MTSGSRRPTTGLSGILALAVVALGGAALIAWRVAVSVRVGPGWDTYAFLSNAAEFAGRGYGYAELHRAPVISLLTAAAFRLGAPLHEAVIQWVDGALSYTGLIAFYLLARRRLAPPLAAASALGLLVVQPLWQYLGSGYTDFPSIALSLWFLLALIAATERNPGYYALAGLLFVVAILTRYTALLIVFPGALWFAMRGSLFRHAKAVAGAIAVAVVAYLPMGSFYAARFGDGLFPFVFAFSVSETVTAPGGEGSVQAAAPFYLTHAPEFLAGAGFAVLGWLALAGALLGLALGTVATVAHSRPGTRRVAAAIGGVALALLGQTGGLFARQLTLPVAVFLVWSAFAPREEGDGREGPIAAAPALDAVMLLWLLVYLDFHGHQSIQVPRYVITMAAPVLYFMALGWWQSAADVGRTLGIRLRDEGSRPGMGQLAGAVGLGLVIALGLASTVATTSHTPDRLVVAARDSARWLVGRDADRESPPVYSDLWPLTAWYARTSVRPMPSYRDIRSYEHELTKHHAEYFVTLRSRRFDEFEVAKTFGPVTVLRRDTPSRGTLPRVAYLGKAWDNYLESVTDFDFFLMSDAGRYGLQGTAFLDGLTAGQLARYDAVAAYGVRWRDRAAGEAALGEHLRSGGTVVIDASANLGKLPYELGDTVMFDTVIKRGSVAKDATIAVEPAFAAAHPEVGSVSPSPFVNEDGGSWYGAEYSELPGSGPLVVLATLGGKPAIAVRRVGRGRVYWIGYNLVWHAFLTDNDDEGRLVRAVFDDAVTHSRRARIRDN